MFLHGKLYLHAAFSIGSTVKAHDSVISALEAHFVYHSFRAARSHPARPCLFSARDVCSWPGQRPPAVQVLSAVGRNELLTLVFEEPPRAVDSLEIVGKGHLAKSPQCHLSHFCSLVV